MFDLIVSQGRVGDRSARTLEGAARTAQAIEQRYGVKGQWVGDPAPPAYDDWRASLSQAEATLVGLTAAVSQSLHGTQLPLLVTNTCSASLATLPVVARLHPNAKILWIDAHGDFNTPETTDTGYLGGMVLSATCGLWDSGYGGDVRPEQVIILGARDIDMAEGELLRAAGVRVISSGDTSTEAVLDAVGDAPVWIHVDWDVLEPGFVPADFKVPRGLLPSQLRTIFEALDSVTILGIEIAEFHPVENEDKNIAAISTIIDTIFPILENIKNSIK